MLRRTTRRSITPLLNEMLNPTIQSPSSPSHFSSAVPSTSNKNNSINNNDTNNRREKIQRDRAHLLKTKTSFVMRNFKNATLFSTRTPSTATAASPASPLPAPGGVLSSTLRSLDKAVKKAVEIERKIAEERKQQRNQQEKEEDERRSAQGSQNQKGSKAPRYQAKQRAISEDQRSSLPTIGREDVVIARMLLGDGVDVLGREYGQIASLAGGTSVSPDSGNTCTNVSPKAYRRDRAEEEEGVVAEPSSSSNRRLDTLHKELHDALEEVRSGIENIGSLSSIGIARVFEAIVAKGQAVTALAVLSKWLQDAHYGPHSDSYIQHNVLTASDGGDGRGFSPTPGTTTSYTAPVRDRASGTPIGRFQLETTLFPFGDAHNTGVGGSTSDGSAYVTGLPGRALILGALVAAHSYDTEAFLTFEAYRKKRIEEDAAARKQRPAVWIQHGHQHSQTMPREEQRGEPSSSSSYMYLRNKTSPSASSKATTSTTAGCIGPPSTSTCSSSTSTEGGDSSTVFENDGDLYAIELCRRWLCNPSSVMHSRREAAYAASASTTTGPRATSELQLLNDILARAKLRRDRSASLWADNQSSPSVGAGVSFPTDGVDEVGGGEAASAYLRPIETLSNTDDVILMVFLTLGAINCRGSLPLVQKRYSTICSYSDRLQQLADRVVGPGIVSKIIAKQHENELREEVEAREQHDHHRPQREQLHQGNPANRNSKQTTNSSSKDSTIKRANGGGGGSGTPPSTPSPYAYVFALCRNCPKLSTIAVSLHSLDMATGGLSLALSSGEDKDEIVVGKKASQRAHARGGLTPAELETVRTVDHLQGRLISEVEALQRYAVRLIVRVFEEGLGCSDAQEERRESVSSLPLRRRAERVVGEVLGAVLGSCEGESPTSLHMAMACHSSRGAALGGNASTQRGNTATNGTPSDAIMNEKDAFESWDDGEEMAANNSHLPQSQQPAISLTFTEILQQKRLQKEAKKAEKAEKIMFGSLTHDFKVIERLGVPTRMPPSPSVSSAAALGMLFPHKVWRTLVALPSLLDAQRQDLVAARERERVGSSGLSAGRVSMIEGVVDLEETLTKIEEGDTGERNDASSSFYSATVAAAPAEIRPTVSVFADQLFLCCFDSLDAALQVISGPSASTRSPSVKTNMAKMSDVLHEIGRTEAGERHTTCSSDSFAADSGAQRGAAAHRDMYPDPLLPPSRRAELAERFDIFVRGAFSRVEENTEAAGEREKKHLSAAFFLASSLSEKEAVLTSFPLQSQLIQFAINDPTTLSDKRHLSLYQDVTSECPPLHEHASSGVMLGSWGGHDAFELFIWQRPDVIYNHFTFLWRHCVRMLRRQYECPLLGLTDLKNTLPSSSSLLATGASSDAALKLGSTNTDNDESLPMSSSFSGSLDWDEGGGSMLNFNVLKRWLQLAAVIGNDRDGADLIAMMRLDLGGEETGGNVGSGASLPSSYRNFRRYIAKIVLAAISSDSKAPALFDAHAAPQGARKERLAALAYSRSVVDSETYYEAKSRSSTGGLDLLLAMGTSGSSGKRGAQEGSRHHGEEEEAACDLGTVPIYPPPSPSLRSSYPLSQARASTNIRGIGFSTTLIVGANGITMIGREPTIFRTPRQQGPIDGEQHQSGNGNDGGDTADAGKGEEVLRSLVGDGAGATQRLHGEKPTGAEAESEGATVVSNPLESEALSFSYGSAQRSTKWEGLGYIDRSLALPQIFSGYLWAEPSVSILGYAGLEGSSSSALTLLTDSLDTDRMDNSSQRHKCQRGANLISQERQLSRPKITHVEIFQALLGVPAQWWQFAVANKIWELTRVHAMTGTQESIVDHDWSHNNGRGGGGSDGGKCAYVQDSPNSKLMVEIVRFLYLGIAVHGRNLLHRLASSTAPRGERDIKNVLLFAHFAGDGLGGCECYPSFSLSNASLGCGFGAPPSAAARGQINDTKDCSWAANLPLSNLVPSHGASAHIGTKPLPSLRVLYKLLLCTMVSTPIFRAALASYSTVKDTHCGGDKDPIYNVVSKSTEEEKALDYEEEKSVDVDRGNGSSRNGSLSSADRFTDDEPTLSFDEDGLGGHAALSFEVSDKNTISFSSFDLGQEESEDMSLLTEEQRRRQSSTSAASRQAVSHVHVATAPPSDAVGRVDTAQDGSTRDGYQSTSLSGISADDIIRDVIVPESSVGALYALLFSIPTLVAARESLLFDASGMVAMFLPLDMQVAAKNMTTTVPHASSHRQGSSVYSPAISTVSHYFALNSAAGDGSSFFTNSMIARAIQTWTSDVNSTVQRFIGSSDDMKEPRRRVEAAIKGMYTPFREARTQLLASLACSLDPVGCLLHWVVAGSGVLHVTADKPPVTVVVPAPSRLNKEAIDVAVAVDIVNATVSLGMHHQSACMLPRHVIAVCRMMAALGYRVPKGLTNSANSKAFGGSFTVDIPLAATIERLPRHGHNHTFVRAGDNNSDPYTDGLSLLASEKSSILQSVWSSHVVPCALDALARCMLCVPETRAVVAALTLGTDPEKARVGASVASSHRQATAPHDAVRYVFRDFFLVNNVDGAVTRERANIAQSSCSHLISSSIPSLQSSLAVTGSFQSTVPILRGIPSNNTFKAFARETSSASSNADNYSEDSSNSRSSEAICTRKPNRTNSHHAHTLPESASKIGLSFAKLELKVNKTAAFAKVLEDQDHRMNTPLDPLHF